MDGTANMPPKKKFSIFQILVLTFSFAGGILSVYLRKAQAKCKSKKLEKIFSRPIDKWSARCYNEYNETRKQKISQSVSSDVKTGKIGVHWTP